MNRWQIEALVTRDSPRGWVTHNSIYQFYYLTSTTTAGETGWEPLDYSDLLRADPTTGLVHYLNGESVSGWGMSGFWLVIQKFILIFEWHLNSSLNSLLSDVTLTMEKQHTKKSYRKMNLIQVSRIWILSVYFANSTFSGNILVLLWMQPLVYWYYYAVFLILLTLVCIYE